MKLFGSWGFQIERAVVAGCGRYDIATFEVLPESSLLVSVCFFKVYAPYKRKCMFFL